MSSPRPLRLLPALAAAVGLAPFPADGVPQQRTEVPARVVDAAEMDGRGFAPAWEFPRERADGTPYPCVAFEERMFALVREPLLPAEDGRAAVWMGDLVRILHAEDFDEDASEDLLDKLKRKLPEEKREAVLDLLGAWDLYGRKWNPRRSSQAHGMHFGPHWEFRRSEWAEAKADREVEQIAQIVLADLAAIKEAEADYAGYWKHVKHDWERIEVVPTSRLQVRDADGALRAASLDIDFEFDLPFPFSTAEFLLHTKNTLLADGRPILYLHGAGSDLHWLAGYDVYEPVRDGEGRWVGTMMVRVFGLDIDGVPDGRGDRHDNLRGQFGNLRRDAERLFAARNAGRAEPEVTPYRGVLPEYRVIDGRRD